MNRRPQAAGCDTSKSPRRTQASTAADWQRFAPLVLVIAAYVFVTIQYLDFVPLWDGAVYYDGARRAIDAVLSTGSLFAAEVHGHVSFAWMLLLSLPTLLAPDDIRVFNAWVVALSVGAVLGFHHLLGTFAGDRIAPWELAPWTAAFAFHPVVTGNWLNPNLDSGLMLFAIFHVLGWVKGRYVLALLAGLGLVFTKETGLLLYPVAPVAVWIAFPGRRAEWRRPMSLAALLVPAAAFVLYAVAKIWHAELPLTWQGLGYWQGVGTVETLLRPLNVLHFDAMTAAQLVHAFVLNGQWVFTGMVGVVLVHYWQSPGKDVAGRRTMTLLLLVSLATLYAVTRFCPHDNTRYVLPFLWSFVLLGAVAVLRVVDRRALRVALGVAAMALSIAGLFRTIDPVSLRLFGSFDFGEHRMLRMTTIARGCCGYGRDQLVYNLQFTNFHYLQYPLFASIRPSAQTVVIQAWDTHWAIQMPLTEEGFRRTMSTGDTVTPIYTYLAEYEQRYADTDEVVYIEYPNADNRRQLERLGQLFRHRWRFTVRRGSYALDAWRFWGRLE